MAMRIALYQIDAFTDTVFKGNPAAICPVTEWLPENVMQAIAMENNLSETVFYVARPDGDFDIRWFTPAAEIDLAGHPTLATAFLILNRLEPSRESARFHSRQGEVLDVVRDGDLLSMNFPARPPAPAADLDGLGDALGSEPVEALAARDAFAVFASADYVLALKPDMNKVMALPYTGVIATAPGTECDFVSRFFAPRHGIPEDPVTGSAHCTLIPYWAERLGKNDLHARQVSRRGGELFCGYLGERVTIAGRAAFFMEGTIEI
jgi:PhzF family phenazine biosynthesis protein